MLNILNIDISNISYAIIMIYFEILVRRILSHRVPIFVTFPPLKIAHVPVHDIWWLFFWTIILMDLLFAFTYQWNAWHIPSYIFSLPFVAYQHLSIVLIQLLSTSKILLILLLTLKKVSRIQSVYHNTSISKTLEYICQ